MSDCRRYAELHGDKHRDDADDVVYRPWHDIRSDQLALDALDRDDAGRGGSSNDVVDADHVADGAALVLQGEDDRRRNVEELRRLELQRGEHDVRHRVRAEHEGADRADEGREVEVVAACKLCNALRHRQQHGGR